jgi:hypothetical protein
MEAMAQEWTEGRLDELSSKVDKGFEQVDRRSEKGDADIRGLRLEMKTEFAAVRADMKETRSELTTSLNSVQRTMVQMMVALTAAILAGFAGICTLIAATL